MTDSETQLDPTGLAYDPCAICMDVIIETAYCDGFVKEQPLEEIGYDSGEVETLDADALSDSSPLDNEYSRWIHYEEI